MELTNGEIFNAREPLKELVNQKFPVKTSYALAKLGAKLNDQLKIIEEVRQKLVATYGGKDPENPMVVKIEPTDNNFGKFMQEFGELMSEKVDIDIEVVTLPDTLEVEPATLMALDKFIKVA